jgi:hypothetical protein
MVVVSAEAAGKGKSKGNLASLPARLPEKLLS